MKFRRDPDDFSIACVVDDLRHFHECIRDAHAPVLRLEMRILLPPLQTTSPVRFLIDDLRIDEVDRQSDQEGYDYNQHCSFLRFVSV